MYIMLSSDKRKRYRNDILKCLAAPVGTQLQFRFSSDIVGESIKDQRRHEGEGLVCYVDLDALGNCSILPIRRVTVNRVFSHGSTFSVSFTVGDFVEGEVEGFSAALRNCSDGSIPHKAVPDNIAEGSRGLFFFEVTNDALSSVPTSRCLSAWENCVTRLYRMAQENQKDSGSQRGSVGSGLESVSVFWTVLGIESSLSTTVSETDQFRPWPKTIKPYKLHSLLLYVFHPEANSWARDEVRLNITSSASFRSDYPPDIAVDCPYDLKRWMFRFIPSNPFLCDKGWISIGHQLTGSAYENEIDWQIDLPLTLAVSWARSVGSATAVGILVGAPSVVPILLNPAVTGATRYIAAGTAVLFGLAATFVAAIGLRRVP